MTTSQIAEKIRENLNKGYSTYFMVDDVKIRVSNHSANRQNNHDVKTLSFITNRTQQNKSAYNSMVTEWVIEDNGLTDTFQEIEEVLDCELN